MPQLRTILDSKTMTLFMIGGVNFLILITALFSYSVHNDISLTRSIIPEGWAMQEDLARMDGNKIIHSLTFTSTKSCEVQEHQEKSGERVLKNTLYPKLSVRFEPSWDKKALKQAEDDFQSCQKEISLRPMMAISCVKNYPIINSSNYAIFIEKMQCSDEAEGFYNKIVTTLTQ